jgi:23S rRNA (pseudouridine1915-N3)-methyltransferase
MKLHLITVGKPKLSYAVSGWEEYLGRLKHYHAIRVTHIPDKHNDASHIREIIGAAYTVALVIQGQQFSSPELAEFLDKRALESREVAFVIGGPDGLPAEIMESADFQLSFSKLTFPHDLAMVVLAEALYRASSISAGSKYHK